jgi:hypothetical protein
MSIKNKRRQEYLEEAEINPFSRGDIVERGTCLEDYDEGEVLGTEGTLVQVRWDLSGYITWEFAFSLWREGQLDWELLCYPPDWESGKEGSNVFTRKNGSGPPVVGEKAYHSGQHGKILEIRGQRILIELGGDSAFYKWVGP